LRGALASDAVEGVVTAELDRVRCHPPIAVRDGVVNYSVTYPGLPSPAACRALARPVLSKVTGSAVPYWATMSLTDAARTRNYLRAIQASTRPNEAAELTTEEWKRTIDQVLDLGVVNISFRGGEVLLRDDVAELVNHVDKNRAAVNVYSDGTTIDKGLLVALKAAGLNALVFHLHASDPDAHDEIAQYPGLYERILKGVSGALDAGLLVGFITRASKEDIESGELEAKIRLARSLGVHQITVVDSIPTGIQLHREDIILDSAQRKAVVALARRYNAEPDGSRVVLEYFPTNGEGPVGPDEELQLHVTSQGDVLPCDYTPLAFGNVRERNVDAIWAEMASHPAYGRPPELVRMQDVGFRRRYIDGLPEHIEVPYYVGGKQKIGMVAGFGEFPIFFAREVRKYGYEVYAVGLEEEVSGRLTDYVDKVWTAGVGQLDEVINLLKEQDLTEVVMVGKVHKASMFGKVQFDERMMKLLASLKIKDDPTILAAIACEMEKEGIHIMEPNHYISSLLIRKGCLTACQPTDRQMQDIHYGYRIAKKIAEIGIGQTVAVKDGAVLAVEAIEGTDKAITRASTLANGDIVVIKVSAPDHDMRFDAPVIGEDTINILFSADARVLAVEADRTIILDREAVINKANDRNISIVAL
jgi:DUF1009 family protein/MoaA/NifB/PqqE/SkfB family radical SAM enzyme